MSRYYRIVCQHEDEIRARTSEHRKVESIVSREVLEAWDSLSAVLEDPDSTVDDLRKAGVHICEALNAFVYGKFNAE